MKKYLTNIALIINVFLIIIYAIYSAHSFLFKGLDEMGIAGFILVIVLAVVLALVIILSLTLVAEIIYLVLEMILKKKIRKKEVKNQKGIVIVFYICTVVMAILGFILALASFYNLLNNLEDGAFAIFNRVISLGYFLLIGIYFVLRIGYVKEFNVNLALLTKAETTFKTINKRRMFKMSIVMMALSFLIFGFRFFVIEEINLLNVFNYCGLFFLLGTYFLINIFHYQEKL